MMIYLILLFKKIIYIIAFNLDIFEVKTCQINFAVHIEILHTITFSSDGPIKLL